MSTTESSAPSASRTSTASTITIVTAVVGGAVLFGAAVSSTLNTFGVFSPRPDLSAVVPFDEDGVFDDGGWDDRGGSSADNATSGAELRSPVSGITGLEVEASAASFTLEFDDVDEAVLTVDHRGSGRGGEWTMRAEDEELVVERASGPRTDGCLFGCGERGGGERVTLTLPQSLGEGDLLNGDLTINSGELQVAGDFAELSLDVNAGSLGFIGSARDLSASVRTGEASIEAKDVREAEFDLEVGDLRAVLSGTAPALVDLEASTGSADLKLPEGEYRVDAEGELGATDNRLSTNDQSKNVVSVRASLAEVTLR